AARGGGWEGGGAGSLQSSAADRPADARRHRQAPPADPLAGVRAHRQGCAECHVGALRGRQPRLQQHPVQVPPADGGLAGRAAPLRFSPPEMKRRLALTRALMAEHGLDALLVFGNSGVNRHNNVNPFWLTQYLDMHHNYAIVPRDGGVELFVGRATPVPNAREQADGAGVEWGGSQRGEPVAARLRELGARRIGLVGVAATWNVGMPYQHYLALEPLETVDMTREFAAL